MGQIRVRRSAPARGAELAPLRASADHAAVPIRVLRTVKTFSRPRWLALHLLVFALAITMILLGRWQLTVSNDKHFDLQNFGYALQWWAFTAFGLFLWLRIMRDHLRRDLGPPPSTNGTLVAADSSTGDRSVGSAWLTSPSAQPGQSPTVYRGYVMPSSTDAPARSDGDPYHATYNDYLWQLALADAADQTRSTRQARTTAPTDVDTRHPPPLDAPGRDADSDPAPTAETAPLATGTPGEDAASPPPSSP